MKFGVFFPCLFAILFLSAFPAQAEKKEAIFAGGCFWCVEKDFEHVKGVIDVVSGYTGGKEENPTYRDYEAKGHIEAAKIIYDDTKISYDELLHTFWRSVNPTDGGGQFCDRGYGYTTAIFALNEEQKQKALASKKALEESGVLKRSIVTPIHDATMFYDAEGYHQNYYNKNPVRYSFYRSRCGRDAAVKAIWGDEAHSGIEKH